MNSQTTRQLRRLKENPFAVLKELENLSKSALAGFAESDSAAHEWVGVGCRLGQERYLIRREEVREVMMMPDEITRVPGAKTWIAGLANLRGQLLPIIDLRAYLGAGSSKGARAGRVLVANNTELPFGVMVDEVFGFRRFPEAAYTDQNPETQIHCDAYLAGACAHDEEIWPVFSLARLAAAEAFQQAAA